MQSRALADRLLLFRPGRARDHEAIERSRVCRRDVIGGERIVDRALDIHRSAARRAARVSYVDLNHDGAVTLSEFAAHVEADMTGGRQRSTFAHTKAFDAEMVLATAKPPGNSRIGERAKARDSNGDWYACRIIDARGKAKNSLIGYEDDEDLWVAPDDLQAIKPARYATGAKVEVLWKKHWYPATVLQAKDGVHLIHYTDYESKWTSGCPRGGSASPSRRQPNLSS